MHPDASSIDASSWMQYPRRSLECPSQDEEGTPLTSQSVQSEPSQTALICTYKSGAGQCEYFFQPTQSFTAGSSLCPQVSDPTLNSATSAGGVPSSSVVGNPTTRSTNPAIGPSASITNTISSRSSLSANPGSTMASAPLVTSASGTDIHSGTLSAGSIAGITVGAAIILMLSFSVFICRRRRWRRNQLEDVERHTDSVTPFGVQPSAQTSGGKRPFLNSSAPIQLSAGSRSELEYLAGQSQQLQSTQGDGSSNSDALRTHIRTLLERELQVYLNGEQLSHFPPAYVN